MKFCSNTWNITITTFNGIWEIFILLSLCFRFPKLSYFPQTHCIIQISIVLDSLFFCDYKVTPLQWLHFKVHPILVNQSKPKRFRISPISLSPCITFYCHFLIHLLFYFITPIVHLESEKVLASLTFPCSLNPITAFCFPFVFRIALLIHAFFETCILWEYPRPQIEPIFIPPRILNFSIRISPAPQISKTDTELRSLTCHIKCSNPHQKQVTVSVSSLRFPISIIILPGASHLALLG